MNEVYTIIGAVIVALLSIAIGVLGNTLHTERKSAKDFRDRVSNSICNSGDLSGSKQRFEDTVAEIRKNGQDKE